MCIYFDKSPPTGIPAPLGAHSYCPADVVHGFPADSVAADILQYMEFDMAEDADEFGWGGGDY